MPNTAGLLNAYVYNMKQCFAGPLSIILQQQTVCLRTTIYFVNLGTIFEMPVCGPRRWIWNKNESDEKIGFSYILLRMICRKIRKFLYKNGVETWVWTDKLSCGQAGRSPQAHESDQQASS